MFIFAIAAGFRDGVPSGRRAAALMEAFPLAPADGISAATSALAAAMVGRWNVVARDRSAVPSWDAAAGVLFAGDVRLHNRAELLSELGRPAGDRDLSDLELARLAYLKWNDEAPLHLIGDFAFAAWNERTRTLFAARDHMGVRPLYYSVLEDGLAVASDVRQLLALVERPLDEIDQREIGDWLTLEIHDPRRTFFRSIHSVAPGHRLVCNARACAETRYWFPSLEPGQSASYEETCENLRATFRRAVGDRLESDYPIVAHSSGGFDSSTIVMAANEIYRSEPTRPALVTASAAAPGMGGDDSRYMDAVARSVSFESVRWNTVEETSPDFPGVYRSRPALRTGLGGGPERDLELARDRNARVLIIGLLGDAVWHATGVLRDFVRHGRWGAVARNFLITGRQGGALRRLVDTALGILPPAPAARVAHALFQRRTPPPEWLGPALRERRPSGRRSPDRPKTEVQSSFHLQSSVWAMLMNPASIFVTDAMVEYGRNVGVEVRIPYADVRLIEAVLAIPWWQREPRGHHRRTGRDALGPLLPREFDKRVGQQAATDIWNATALRRTASLAPFFDAGPWLSGPYVDRGIARAMLRDVLMQGPRAAPENAILVGEFAALEAWLRELFG